MRWLITSFLFIISSFFLVTAKNAHDTLDALLAFTISFGFVYILWNSDKPAIKKFLELF